MNIKDFILKKERQEKITMLTCYDSTFAALLESCKLDSILVGDSLGMVIKGDKTTLTVSLEEIKYHLKCVSAKSKIVMKTNCVSKLGKEYNRIKYNSGKSIGNFTKKTSFLKSTLIINLVRIVLYNLSLNLYFVYFFLNNNFLLLKHLIRFP